MGCFLQRRWGFLQRNRGRCGLPDRRCRIRVLARVARVLSSSLLCWRHVSHNQNPGGTMALRRPGQRGISPLRGLPVGPSLIFSDVQNKAVKNRNNKHGYRDSLEHAHLWHVPCYHRFVDGSASSDQDCVDKAKKLIEDAIEKARPRWPSARGAGQRRVFSAFGRRRQPILELSPRNGQKFGEARQFSGSSAQTGRIQIQPPAQTIFGATKVDSKLVAKCGP